MNILCIGAGYVGGPTMAVIAKYCKDHKITVVDINQERIKAWNSDNLPIYEPGLLEVVKEARGRNLFFTTDLAKEITDADMVFVSINTPTKTYGEAAGRGADLQFWEAVARSILEHATKKEVIVVEKSTLPVRAAEAMARILHHGNHTTQFEVISNPEFLAEGTAIQDLEHPDRVLIGGRETASGQKAVKALVGLYAHWVPAERIITTNVWSSELSKLTANAFLAQRISSINTISALCEKTGADVQEVAKAIGMDSRIGPKFLEAGVGFGGSCFRKDILHLSYLAEYYGLPEVADYWASVVSINEYQTNRFFRSILSTSFNTLANKKIAIFGFSFKPDTGDTRDSPAITLCQKLAQERAKIAIHDPKALENAKQDLKDIQGDFQYVDDPYEAANGAHVIALVTHWQDYKALDYQKIYDSMIKPAFLFDGRNLLDHQALAEIGFHVFPIGKKPFTNI